MTIAAGVGTLLVAVNIGMATRRPLPFGNALAAVVLLGATSGLYSTLGFHGAELAIAPGLLAILCSIAGGAVGIAIALWPKRATHADEKTKA